MTPDKQQAELLKQTQKKYFRAVFGTAYLHMLLRYLWLQSA